MRICENVIFLPFQISTSAVGALPLVPLPTVDVSGRKAHVPQTDVWAQHPVPPTRLQAGVPRPLVWAPCHGRGAHSPHVPPLHDDQTGAQGFHLWLRWVGVLVVLFFFGGGGGGNRDAVKCVVFNIVVSLSYLVFGVLVGSPLAVAKAAAPLPGVQHRTRNMR